MATAKKIPTKTTKSAFPTKAAKTQTKVAPVAADRKSHQSVAARAFLDREKAKGTSKRITRAENDAEVTKSFGILEDRITTLDRFTARHFAKQGECISRLTTLAEQTQDYTEWLAEGVNLLDEFSDTQDDAIDNLYDMVEELQAELAATTIWSLIGDVFRRNYYAVKIAVTNFRKAIGGGPIDLGLETEVATDEGQEAATFDFNFVPLAEYFREIPNLNTGQPAFPISEGTTEPEAREIVVAAILAINERKRAAAAFAEGRQKYDSEQQDSGEGCDRSIEPFELEITEDYLHEGIHALAQIAKSATGAWVDPMYSVVSELIREHMELLARLNENPDYRILLTEAPEVGVASLTPELAEVLGEKFFQVVCNITGATLKAQLSSLDLLAAGLVSDGDVPETDETQEAGCGHSDCEVCSGNEAATPAALGEDAAPNSIDPTLNQF